MGEEFCIEGVFLLPDLYFVESDFNLKSIPKPSKFVSSELCFVVDELLKENADYNLSINLFKFFEKNIALTTTPYPKINELPEKQEYHVKDYVLFDLDNSISPFTYHISTKDREVECERKDLQIECGLDELGLEQGEKYDLNIYSKYFSEKVQDFGTMNIQTPQPVIVKESSIKEGAVFYEEISEISFIFNKEVSEDFDLLLQDDSGEEITSKFNLSGADLVVEIDEKIQIGTVVKLSLKNVNGLDGSFLSKEYVLNFSVLERPPRNWWDYPSEILPTVKSGDDLLVVVSKKYKLPSNYVPKDLTNVNKSNIKTSKEILVRAIVINDLKKLGEAAKIDGIDLSIISGYRSYNTQGSTYQHWLSANGGNVGVTDQISARPGHSEHQLGTTVDFSTNKAGFSTFNNTPASAWLEKNAYKYGFVLSYPRGSETVTGFTYEGWHYRYLGIENAKKQKESGLIPLQWLLSQ